MRLSRRMRLGLLAVGLVCVIGAAGVLAVLFGVFQPSVVSDAVNQPLTPAEMAQLVPRGRYLTLAADCAACHTAPGGAPYAGGLGFALPVGTLYATNISPDPTYGIGQWSRADFQHAMRDGIGPGHSYLFPAMPYVSYRQMSEGDVDAVYAYLMTRQPIHQASPRDSFPLPYMRLGMAFWNLINLPSRGFVTDAALSPTINRGRYLVDALGHCGECHTPRDISMGMIPGRYLQGATIEGVDAPDITPAGLARLGFDAPTLAQFMRAGLGPQGVTTFSMYEVIEHSTRYLTPADAEAMADYLMQGAPPPVVVTVGAVTPGTEHGRQSYVAVCAGCHGLNGVGVPHVAPAMRTNATLRLPSDRNLMRIMSDGLPAQSFPDGEAMQPMPGFAHLLTHQELVDLAAYLRSTWGGHPPH
ncbi:cytochrome c [Acidisoma cellulosilytica]|uniref:Cytochrome c n=1 Tax=Acidisoma cellulosilyticum TaxID=2802395 RepID=A0A964E4A3_9PROT|nr:cytochrome c [Acidisoma cellulosilyticum]MCB8881251.1 cytochrome c [Acidisoma cellulosilyticum]